MRPLDHREPGVLGTVLDTPTLFAELIADGVHVHPALVRLWLRCKAPAHAILVTDSISATGMPPGHYTLAALPVTTDDTRALLTADLATGKKTLAGSILTMDRAVANLQTFTGCSLATATGAASHNPATMLGLGQLTSLTPGAPAHLNRFSAEGTLLTTHLHGQAVR
jgi:N-acetylglucosamine-6-phosphate deacetylase